MTIHIGRREFISALWSGGCCVAAGGPRATTASDPAARCADGLAGERLELQPRRSTSTCRCTSTNSPTSYAPALGPTPLGVASVSMIPLAFGLRENRTPTTNTATRTVTQNTKDALQEAFHTQGFWLLPIGFFVCGFNVAFIGLSCKRIREGRQMHVVHHSGMNSPEARLSLLAASLRLLRLSGDRCQQRERPCATLRRRSA